MSDRPNILYIITDQQHARMMSCAGNPHVHTPAMDSLAAEGVRFDRAYCTNPVCIAARFSLMTGRMPSAINMLSNRIAGTDDISETIRENGLGHLMRKAGYETAYGGKVHLPKMSIEDVGFDGICTNERDELATATVNFLEAEHDKPFFLVTSFINPHDICYMALRDFATDDGAKGILEHGRIECETLDVGLERPEGVSDEAFFAEHCPPLPPNFEPQEGEPEALRLMLEARPFRMKARKNWSEERWREHRWAYAKLTEIVDRQIGQVLDALKKSAYADNTIIVFTSDHGDMDASHRMEHKSTFYDEAARVPLIIRPAGGMPPSVDDTHLASSGLDLVPTFCDWAGVTPPSDLQGLSLRPLVENGEHANWRESLPVECAVGRAVITERFKYCRYDIGANREQLIDLQTDPWEKRNAIGDPEHREAIQSLSATFEQTFGREMRDESEAMEAARHA